MGLVLILLAVIIFIVYATAKLKLDAFFVLLLAAFLAAFAYQIPLNEIASTITKGFGGILGYIGLVIVLGTIIGVLLEKSGAAISIFPVQPHVGWFGLSCSNHGYLNPGCFCYGSYLCIKSVLAIRSIT